MSANHLRPLHKASHHVQQAIKVLQHIQCLEVEDTPNLNYTIEELEAFQLLLTNRITEYKDAKSKRRIVR